MRVALLLLLFTGPVVAAEPNTLTAKEAEEGWLLLFDGHSTFGWTTEGKVSVVDGALKMEAGSKLTHLTTFGLFEMTRDMSVDGKTWQTTKLVNEVAKNAKDVTWEPFTIQAPATVYYRNLKLRLRDTKSLFNGKDLTGWKVFPGAKDRKVTSKFAVTKEGWLNVKDGPGDLQTEGQWADFVVQLECISNGKHLNSGLFFRCLPDVYQQGYEAQIRNEWMDDDRTKPVDFGTGAIYRRQAARKVVSTDGQWFTLTVAASGKHLATWVNGDQVASWTDDRKEADNGRNGAKTTKGALSIQGHDPTTDLSFRNIRIQSLDKK